MNIDGLDHLVLTVRSIDETVAFYTSVLGMECIGFGENRVALKFGRQKLNLHEAGKEFEPKAGEPTPGSADLCFIASTKLEDAMYHVAMQGVEILQGPVERTGANGPIDSFYFRDPDGNLIEVANEQPAAL